MSTTLVRLTAAERIIALLRTLTDAQQDWDPRSGGEGARLMPRAYHEGSYRELERCLATMRTQHRLEWWHLSQRYRWGIERWATIPYRRTPKGPHPLLPPHSELLIAGDTRSVRHMHAKLYEWNPAVDATLVAAGITWLEHTMHDGDTTRIKLPSELLWNLLGITRPAA